MKMTIIECIIKYRLNVSSLAISMNMPIQSLHDKISGRGKRHLTIEERDKLQAIINALGKGLAEVELY